MNINEASAAIWAALRVDKDLAASFLAIFARFEYSLKREGFLKPGRQARPNWSSFSTSLNAECRLADIDALLQSVPYLAENQSREQIVENGTLSWAESTGNLQTLSGLLQAVRTTRNNLFHGGKFAVSPIDEPLRDKQLIIDSARVLLQCLDLDCASARGLKASFWSFDAY